MVSEKSRFKVWLWVDGLLVGLGCFFLSLAMALGWLCWLFGLVFLFGWASLWLCELVFVAVLVRSRVFGFCFSGLFFCGCFFFVFFFGSYFFSVSWGLVCVSVFLSLFWVFVSLSVCHFERCHFGSCYLKLWNSSTLVWVIFGRARHPFNCCCCLSMCWSYGFFWLSVIYHGNWYCFILVQLQSLWGAKRLALIMLV